MKPVNRKKAFLLCFHGIVIFVVGSAFLVSSDDGHRKIRKVRPMSRVRLEPFNPASKVKLNLNKGTADHLAKNGKGAEGSGKVIPKDLPGDSVKAAKLGWAYFERQNWEAARDWFITAMEWDPSNADPAKGLVLSVYYGTSIEEAYQLGEKLGAVIPEVKKVVPDTIRDEAETLLDTGNTKGAIELVKRLPSGSPLTVALKRKVTSSVEPEHEVPSVVEFVKGEKANGNP